jgi:membrane-associated phospholipid phosphatase
MKQRVAFSRVATVVLASLAASLTLPAAGQASGEGAQVGKWKTWLLTSGSEISVPAPPADNSAQTQAELAELRLLQAIRSPILTGVVNSWNSVPATQPWNELARKQPAGNPVRANRVLAYVHTAMYDAVVAAYQAKYTYNRKAPHLLATDLIPSATVPAEPSYPSEHAALAGAAAGVLSALFPADAKTFAAMAEEAALSRLLAGANYRSDVEAGLALGRAVAAKAIARAQADGSDAKWTGTVPTGPGYWVGTNPVEPLAGTWKTWLLSSASQIRPGPPPAFDSPEFKAELDQLKQIMANPTLWERTLAQFWATNGANPFWEAANFLVARNRLSTPQAARVLALLAVALMDATTAEWEAKYTYWQIRPSQADPTIVPLVPLPNYPSYPSGLSGVGGVMTEVLAYFFPPEAGRLRQMAEAAAVSRMYGGVHFRSDNEAGLQLGRRMAELAIQQDRMNGN